MLKVKFYSNELVFGVLSFILESKFWEPVFEKLKNIYFIFFGFSYVFLYKQRLCYSVVYLFFLIYVANIVATKCVHFESVHFDQ